MSWYILDSKDFQYRMKRETSKSRGDKEILYIKKKLFIILKLKILSNYVHQHV